MRFENFIKESMLTESFVNTFPPFIEDKMEELLTELDSLIDVCYEMRNAVKMREIDSLKQYANDIKVKASLIPESVSLIFFIADTLDINIGQK